ncbi:glycosyltransferase family 4 protein [Halocatena salina]|uniref:Glycosyltransferase family 4 protein n=1 Tax=Halocatena salina TaxID=2934340 RepID=A0A8U0A2N8_9EURY|nr:glycosyltransferase family 4 protein [Halocatena salina]UPM43420.1 glycosyltransferase family 4 protein [Halocatena salina]
MNERLDVGFIPAECPGAAGTGAVRTSTLLIERLSKHHDLTVYVSSQMDASSATLPAEDRVNYVIHDNLPKLPHPLTNKIDTLEGEIDALERHELIHSYSSAFIPVLAELDTPTLSTLNSYLPVCPKGDMMYDGERKCSGPGRLKCASCISTTALKRRQGVDAELRSGYVSLGQIEFVFDSIDRAWEIDAYHALSPHLAKDFGAIGFPDNRIEVIPHFYDETFATITDEGESEREPTPEDDEPITLLYVGALQDIKGVHVLIRGLSRILSRGYDIELQVAGSGPYEQQLHELAQDLDLDEAIRWLGYVDHDRLAAVYENADVFVYPGLLDEPFGRVLLEALSSHTPILAADVGSTDYIVGPAGEQFMSGEPEALADAFERLIDDYTAHYDAIPEHIERFAPETVERAFSERYHDVASMAD